MRTPTEILFSISSSIIFRYLDTWFHVTMFKRDIRTTVRSFIPAALSSLLLNQQKRYSWQLTTWWHSFRKLISVTKTFIMIKTSRGVIFFLTERFIKMSLKTESLHLTALWFLSCSQSFLGRTALCCLTPILDPGCFLTVIFNWMNKVEL